MTTIWIVWNQFQSHEYYLDCAKITNQGHVFFWSVPFYKREPCVLFGTLVLFSKKGYITQIPQFKYLALWWYLSLQFVHKLIVPDKELSRINIECVVQYKLWGLATVTWQKLWARDLQPWTATPYRRHWGNWHFAIKMPLMAGILPSIKKKEM